MQSNAWIGKWAARRPRLTAGRVLGAAALAATAFQLVRTTLRMRRELADFHDSDAQLLEDWTTIPAIASIGELRMHARVRNDAPTLLPPLVLVHGCGIASSYLVPLAARLAGHAHVYAPELPGHGESDHDSHPLTLWELAQALVAWMDARGLRSAILLGHSLGCQVVAEAAARRPDLAAGLVLVGPTCDASARSMPKQVGRALAASIHERPSVSLWASLDYDRAGADVLDEEMHEMVKHHLEDVLPRIAAPVRVVRGERDHIAPQAWAEAVARLARAPAPIVIPKWGHAVHYDDPDAVAGVVLALAHTLPARTH